MNKEQIITLAITDLNNLGCGVGRYEPEGKVVFVKGAVTGDLVRAKVIKVNQSFAVAKLLEICEPSPYRPAEDACSAPLSCGGCIYRHVTYEHELALKREYVKNAFVKAGLRDVTVLPVLSTGQTEGYRNKGQYPLTTAKGEIRAGFYAAGTHTVVPCEDCCIQSEAFAPLVRRICRFGTEAGWTTYDEKTGKGLLRHIYLRRGEASEQTMVCLVLNGEKLPEEERFAKELTEAFPQIVSLLINTNKENTNVVLGKKFRVLWGAEALEDRLCGLTFRISADSFYQVNRQGAELLYTKAAELADLKGDETLVDLYCGTGTIGLSMAAKARRLVGVELVASAVDCAKENAKRNGIGNAEFYCGDASSRETILACTKGQVPDVVVIDPPRKGSTRELVECLSGLGVRRVVYVSCNPDTLARDCVWFREAGYTMGDIQPVDMFPRTGHVETIVCLNKQ